MTRVAVLGIIPGTQKVFNEAQFPPPLLLYLHLLSTVVDAYSKCSRIFTKRLFWKKVDKG